MRAELNCATVWPSAGMAPAPNWLVVSTTTLPASDPASSSAWSMAPQGTASITTSASATRMRPGRPAPTWSPSSAARAASWSGCREKLISTSWPARDHDRAALPPIRPAPTMAMRIGFGVTPAAAGVQHRYTAAGDKLGLCQPGYGRARDPRPAPDALCGRGGEGAGLLTRRGQLARRPAGGVAAGQGGRGGAGGAALRADQPRRRADSGRRGVRPGGAANARRRRPRGATSPGRSARRGRNAELGYTLATVYETLPALIDALAAEHPELQVRPREVFAEDIERMLGDGRVDLALAPTSPPGPGLSSSLSARSRSWPPWPTAIHWPRRSTSRSPRWRTRRSSCGPTPCRRVTTTPSSPPAVMQGSNLGSTSRPPVPPSGATSPAGVASAWSSGRSATSSRGASPSSCSPAPAPTLAIDLVWPVDRTTPAVRGLIAVADRLAQSRGWLRVSSKH